ncbi:Replicase polyprotein 1ab [Plantactinospora sp. WMMB334]|uniref:Replicase polyprotein 1ab n=1 Tax=Plantactinospora sp. WMMB334 TaxID=3404119 RepID=UPI003B94CB70
MLSLAKPVAESVARHLVATGQLLDDDPSLALEHALAARRLAARIAPVREAVGLAAYRAGEWQTALAELRTYHRMSGRQTHLAVLADCERALGRPERAIDLYRGADREALDPAGAVELLIVAAGARGDLGQGDAAVAMLQVRELTAGTTEPWAARLRYAYADALLSAGRREEAREWFSRAAEVDEFGETDAAERLLELDGVVLEGDDESEDGYDDGDDGDGADRAQDAGMYADADTHAAPDADVDPGGDADLDANADPGGDVDPRGDANADPDGGGVDPDGDGVGTAGAVAPGGGEIGDGEQDTEVDEGPDPGPDERTGGSANGRVAEPDPARPTRTAES